MQCYIYLCGIRTRPITFIKFSNRFMTCKRQKASPASERQVSFFFLIQCSGDQLGSASLGWAQESLGSQVLLAILQSHEQNQLYTRHGTTWRGPREPPLNTSYLCPKELMLSKTCNPCIPQFKLEVSDSPEVASHTKAQRIEDGVFSEKGEGQV